MFNNADERARVLIDVSLIDGRKLKGNLLMAPSSTLGRTINNDALFIEFEDLEGVMHMIAKRAIVEVIAASLPRTAKLDVKTLDVQYAPHKALGLTPDASAADIDAAYARLIGAYDPARFANAELPEEIARYLDAKRTNIQAAYNFLTGKATEAAA